jgi:hypothetical protein
MFDSRKEIIMSKLKNSLVAFAGLSLVMGSIALITPTRTQGQGGNQQPLNVNVVNSPTVKVTDLYPQPFQGKLTIPSSGGEVCVSVPVDQGLIIELVTARASGPSALSHFILGMSTTAGGQTPVSHGIVLQKQQANINSAHLAVAQPLRAYADPGTDLCFQALDFDAGPTTTFISFSGQLVNAP